MGIVLFVSGIVLMIAYLVWFCFGQRSGSQFVSVIVNMILITLSVGGFAVCITVNSMYPEQGDSNGEIPSEIQTETHSSDWEYQPETPDIHSSERKYEPETPHTEKPEAESTVNVVEEGTATTEAEPSPTEGAETGSVPTETAETESSQTEDTDTEPLSTETSEAEPSPTTDLPTEPLRKDPTEAEHDKSRTPTDKGPTKGTETPGENDSLTTKPEDSASGTV